jgi:LmbE family N-acetylglucosaminyl deacetylase
MADTKLRILGINAHPHDFTHYAGTLGIHASQGDEVTVVSMTAGVNIHNERLADELLKPPEERDQAVMSETADQYTDLKVDELKRACAVFGITDVRMLGFPEPFRLNEHPESVTALQEIIQEVRPHIMITQTPFLMDHGTGYPSGAADDHLETAIASLDARGRASNATHGMTIAPHRIAVTYYPGVYFERNEIDFIVDVSDWFEQRVEAEAVYVSQGHTPESSRQRMLLTLGNLGFFKHIPYAEGFVREKSELLSRLPVPESAIQQAEESHEEMLQRRLSKE